MEISMAVQKAHNTNSTAESDFASHLHCALLFSQQILLRSVIFQTPCGADRHTFSPSGKDEPPEKGIQICKQMCPAGKWEGLAGLGPRIMGRAQHSDGRGGETPWGWLVGQELNNDEASCCKSQRRMFQAAKNREREFPEGRKSWAFRRN